MTDLREQTSWVAVDWGTTNLRVWFMNENNAVLDQVSTEQGMGALSRDAFEPALIAALAPVLSDTRVLPVVCCGMVGSRQGWFEAPYATVPVSPLDAQNVVTVPTTDPRINAFILSGIKQMTPPDVMRGEETQIAGVLRAYPNFSGCICLPGTHTKWAMVSGGKLTKFNTFMTGEIYALLSKQSVLRHSVDGAAWDDAGFVQGVQTSVAAPEKVAASLFGIRAGDLLLDRTVDVSNGLLSGYLIGAEIAAMRDDLGSSPVVIAGAPKLSALYAQALATIEITADIHDGETCTLDGLIAGYELLKDTL